MAQDSLMGSHGEAAATTPEMMSIIRPAPTLTYSPISFAIFTVKINARIAAIPLMAEMAILWRGVNLWVELSADMVAETVSKMSVARPKYP